MTTVEIILTFEMTPEEAAEDWRDSTLTDRIYEAFHDIVCRPHEPGEQCSRDLSFSGRQVHE